METGRRLRVAEETLRRFSAAVRTAQLYAPGHPLVQRSLDALAETVHQLVADQPIVALGFLDQEIVVGDTPLGRTENYGELARRLHTIGIERIAFERGVEPQELSTLVLTIARPERIPGEASAGAKPADAMASLQSLPHISVGRI